MSITSTVRQASIMIMGVFGLCKGTQGIKKAREGWSAFSIFSVASQSRYAVLCWSSLSLTDCRDRGVEMGCLQVGFLSSSVNLAIIRLIGGSWYPQ